MNISATFEIAGEKHSDTHPAEVVIIIKKNGKQFHVIGLHYEAKEWKANSTREEGLFMKFISGGAPISHPKMQNYINAQYQYAQACYETTGVDKPRSWNLLTVKDVQ